jgi:hypothetical protein
MFFDPVLWICENFSSESRLVLRFGRTVGQGAETSSLIFENPLWRVYIFHIPPQFQAPRRENLPTLGLTNLHNKRGN